MIVRTLEAQGLDSKLLCSQSGIDYDQLQLGAQRTSAQEPDLRIKQSAVTALWNCAVQLSGNESIALNLATNVTADALHLIGYSMMSSTTLLEGCQRFVRYQRAVGELFEISLTSDEGYYALDFGFRDVSEDFATQSIDAALAVTVGFVRWLTQRPDCSPERVYLMREAPLDTKAYTELFQCPVLFGQSSNQMHYATSTMALVIPTAHEELSGIHEQLLGAYLKGMDKRNTTDIYDIVEEQVIKMLPSGLPKVSAVAAALNMSARTLHRRLGEVDLNYQSSLELVRKRLAKRYLESSLSLKEVAYLIGFAELSSFYRAFKRWYGIPPKQYVLALKNEK